MEVFQGITQLPTLEHHLRHVEKGAKVTVIDTNGRPYSVGTVHRPAGPRSRSLRIQDGENWCYSYRLTDGSGIDTQYGLRAYEPEDEERVRLRVRIERLTKDRNDADGTAAHCRAMAEKSRREVEEYDRRAEAARKQSEDVIAALAPLHARAAELGDGRKTT